jgi:hypothetical protein
MRCSAALRPHPVIGFLFQCRHNFVKSSHIGGAHAPHDGSFQIGQMAADTPGQLSALRCQDDDECAAILFPYFARDQTAVSKTVEDTG